uniref:transposase n=1 Tax=Vibrio tarriae TaxID=2014742 RepID=UPI0035A26703
MPKPRYKTTNWKQYKKKRERPCCFSAIVITTALMMRRIFAMPLRTLQGFTNSIFTLHCSVHITPVSVAVLDRLKSHSNLKFLE